MASHQLTRPWGLCSHTVLAFSMTEAAMTVNPLGNGLSSCLHSSCTTLRLSPGPAAAASISPGSLSKSLPELWALSEPLRSGCDRGDADSTLEDKQEFTHV